MRHPGGIQGRAEDVDLILRGAECFDAFICLLAIIESWGKAMNAKERILDELRFAPLAGLDAVVGLNMSIDFFCILAFRAHNAISGAHLRGL